MISADFIFKTFKNIYIHLTVQFLSKVGGRGHFKNGVTFLSGIEKSALTIGLFTQFLVFGCLYCQKSREERGDETGQDFPLYMRIKTQLR